MHPEERDNTSIATPTFGLASETSLTLGTENAILFP
jgi:hypothetical protein